jgi:hypothetical protein
VQRSVDSEVVQAPIGAIAEDSDVALAQPARSIADVAGELALGFLAHSGLAQIALEFDHGEASLDVDPPAAAGLGLQLDLQVVLGQVQPAIEKQRLHIGLEVGFGAARPAGQPTDKRRKVDDPCGHAEMLADGAASRPSLPHWRRSATSPFSYRPPDPWTAKTKMRTAATAIKRTTAIAVHAAVPKS